MSSFRRRLPLLAIVATVALIAGVTLLEGVPPSKTEIVPPWYCLVCGSGGTADALLNIALFVPLGAALCWAGLGAMRSLVMAALLSTSVELAQATIIPFRYPALGDVVWNSLGGLFGAIGLLRWRTLLFPAPAQGRRLRRLACWGMGIAVTATVVAFRPAVPMGHYQLREFDRCLPPASDRGPLLDRIRYGALPVTRGVAIPAASLRAQWRASSLQVSGVTTPASCDDVLSLVTSASGSPKELFGLSRSVSGMSFRVRLRASDMRLRQPAVLLPLEYLAIYGSTSAAIVGRFDHGRLSIDFDMAGTSRRAELPLTPGFGWALFYPFDELFRLRDGRMNIAWMILLSLPIGFFTRVASAPASKRDHREDSQRDTTNGRARSDDTDGRAHARSTLLASCAVALTIAVAGQLLSVGRLAPLELLGTLAGVVIGSAMGEVLHTIHERARALQG